MPETMDLPEEYKQNYEDFESQFAVHAVEHLEVSCLPLIYFDNESYQRQMVEWTDDISLNIGVPEPLDCYPAIKNEAHQVRLHSPFKPPTQVLTSRLSPFS